MAASKTYGGEACVQRWLFDDCFCLDLIFPGVDDSSIKRMVGIKRYAGRLYFVDNLIHFSVAVTGGEGEEK